MKRLLNKYIPLAYGSYFKSLAVVSSERAAEKAFVLFCTPRKGRVLPEQSVYLDEAKDQVLKIQNTSIQTYCWPGSGPTVLLMHGWESNTFRWRNLISKLQEENYNIIALDGPAHGNSTGKQLNVPLYAECIQAVIKTYNPTYLIGHSFGGMAMIYNQYKHPNDAVKKMVSLGAPSELSDFMAQYRNLLGLNQRMMTSLEAYFIKTFNFGFSDFSTPKFAKSFTKEGLLIHDELDAIASITSSENLHASWKNSTLIRTNGLGHSLHQDAVRNQIVAFLKS
ncbi:alpha/beta fold hydrolase [Spongiimicrobium sp. 3-5]|uniref:alpha/beta fold hydrolase n=1 Tax=Spongiimicrobium sp. 3-5 TaxID=3332596 RepID=UPI00398180B7